MQPTSAIENGLLFADQLRHLNEKFNRMLRVRWIQSNFSIDLEGLKRSFAADAAARRHIEMSLKPFQIEFTVHRHRDRGVGALFQCIDRFASMENSFCVKESGCQRLVLPWRTHRNRNRFTYQHSSPAE